MQTIYEPKGKAKEYGDLALNIYTGCSHRCVYCYAPAVLRKDRNIFHNFIEPRKNIVEETKKHLAKGDMQGKLIHLCFTCDPYPNGIDTTPTREIIRAIKNSGNHVQILTKGGGAERDFDLLDSTDWFGVTLSGAMQGKEPYALPAAKRLNALYNAKQNGVSTWVSCEPVYDIDFIYWLIKSIPDIDLFKIGKLNYAPSNIDWGEFGRECERLCIGHNRNYMIKDGLRAEMQKP